MRTQVTFAAAIAIAFSLLLGAVFVLGDDSNPQELPVALTTPPLFTPDVPPPDKLTPEPGRGQPVVEPERTKTYAPSDNPPAFDELTQVDGRFELSPREDECAWRETNRVRERLPERERLVAILESDCYPDYLYQVDLDTKEVETLIK